MIERIRQWARTLRRDVIAMWFAARDPDTPWFARVLLWIVLLYALSPIDLIPDFIPVIGWLDELLLLPGLIWLVRRLIPDPVMARAQERASGVTVKPRLLAGGALIVLLWIATAAALGWWWMHRDRGDAAGLPPAPATAATRH